MRGLRLTKKLTNYLVELLSTGSRDHDEKLDGEILERIRRLSEPAGLDVAPLEAALIASARGKVVPTTAGGHARASKQALAVGATVEAMGEVGVWLSRQRWLYEPLTIITVLNKWADWYPKAHATAAPKGVTEGLGGKTTNMGPGTQGGSNSFAHGRAKEGFR